MWQPANPNFGQFCHAFTFIAVPFERYIVAAARKAADRLNQDPDVASEAEAFLRQAAQHAAAHRKHVIALVARHPELEQCYEEACRAYDQLIDEQPIEFHAAYIANLEAYPADAVAVPGGAARRRCFTRCRQVIWSRWCGAWRCRRPRIMIPLTSRCPTGRTPGCGNTTAVPT